MGIGGLLGGLGQMSVPIQNGQLQGQIEGKQMGMNYQIQLANLMREQELARSEMAKNQAMGDFYSGKNQTALGVQGMKGQTAEDVAGTRAGSEQAIAGLRAQMEQQGNDLKQRLADAHNDLQRQFYQNQLAALHQRKDMFDERMGAVYANQFLSQNKDLAGTMKGFAQADAALSQAKAQNPAAVRATLLSLAQNDTGGGGARKAVIDYAAKIHPDLVGSLSQNIGLLGSGAFSDGDIQNIASLISQQHQTTKALYTQRYMKAAQEHPAAAGAFAPYDPNTTFDIPGNPSGMGTNPQAPPMGAPPAASGVPGAGQKTRTESQMRAFLTRNPGVNEQAYRSAFTVTPDQAAGTPNGVMAPSN